MATIMTSPLLARVAGQASRRGMIPRVPSGDSLVAAVEAWLTSAFPETVRSSRRTVLDSGATELAVVLHPAAPE
ncbi:MAG TPA: hypothetical protein VGQ31_00315, partial [Candidatus Limnocylindrales bacterium]|nr:hypothetical protein [Candidatus Limnocylindrales bacterium]